MLSIVLVGLAIMALMVEGKVAPENVKVSVFNYHEEFGIPEAARIKEVEDRIMASMNVPGQDESKIVGGAIAPETQYPYLAGLLISFVNTPGRSACGASLVTNNRLVSAAHCWFDGTNQAREFEVVLGSQYLYYYGTRVVTSQVVSHPQYNPQLISNDVLVIKLPYSVAFTNAIQPVSLPSSNQLYDTFEGQWVYAAGYGKTTDLEAGVSSNAQIRHVSLRVISNTECSWSFGNYILSSTICTSGAGNVGICGGDSGGPLVLKQGGSNVLVGISSFVAYQMCHMGYPSAFARVTSFYSFIAQNLY